MSDILIFTLLNVSSLLAAVLFLKYLIIGFNAIIAVIRAVNDPKTAPRTSTQLSIESVPISFSKV
jgi:hypothetical protein